MKDDRPGPRSRPGDWMAVVWLGAGSVAGWALAALPGGLVTYGVEAFSAQFSGTRGPGLSFPLEVIAVAAGLWAAPRLLKAYGLLARSMLAPSGQAEVALRVRDLAWLSTVCPASPPHPAARPR